MNEEENSEYQIEITPLALEMLAAVKDRREQEKLRDRIDRLKVEPEKQGKALVDNLSGFRSIRAIGQRYSGSQINEVYRNPVLSSFPGQNSYLTFLRKAISDCLQS